MTKIEYKGEYIVIESSDENIELRLSQTALSTIMASSKKPSVPEGWDIPGFIKKTKQTETQKAILELLVRDGSASRQDMIEAAGFTKGSASLAGCRGSMTQNAIRYGLPKDWWSDEYKNGEVVTSIRSDIRNYLLEAGAGTGVVDKLIKALTK